MPVVTVSTKGQIILPKEIREALDLREGDRLRATVEGDQVLLKRLPRPDRGDWRRWRGFLAGTRAVEEHLTEHAEEVKRERMP